MSLTLCLIVKNEAHYLARCIESVQHLVSDILIGDTGSTDDTIEIARRYTSHVETVDFSEGFSAARNQILRQVKTEWVLFLDADEYFDESQAQLLKALLDSAPDADAFRNIRYNFFATGGFYVSEVIRLFRNVPEIEYTGVVVDSIKPSLEKHHKKCVEASFVLNHFGHCRFLSVRNEKALKYLTLMDQELEQKPSNYRVLGYKGLVLKSLGHFDEAFHWASKALEVAPKAGHPHFVQARLLRGMHQIEAEFFHYNKALDIEPSNLIYLNSRGVAYLTYGHIEKARADFEEGLRRAPHQIHFKLNLGLTYEAAEAFEQAYSLYKEVAQTHPAFLESSFVGLVEVDLYSPLIYDTIFRYHGLSYHLAYCHTQMLALVGG